MDDRAGPAPRELSPARVFGVIFGFSLLVQLAGPYGNVSAVGTLDPWFYTGYFQNFGDLVDRFGAPYYVTRLPYILVGVAVYTVFSPLVANLVLNALLLTSVLGPLFLILHRQFGPMAALIGTAAGAGNAWLATSIIWDYPDGPAISYVLLGLWLALAPPRAVAGRGALVLAGACWTMAGLTNFIAGVIIIAAIATVLIWRGQTIRQTIMDLLWLLAGAVGCLGVWCAISRSCLGVWNILGPQWQQLHYATVHPEVLPDLWGRGYEWVRSAFRLWPPLVALLVGGWMLFLPAYRPSPHRRALLAAWTGLAIAAVIFGWAEFGANKVLLRVSYHSSYSVVPLLLCMTVLSGVVLADQPGGKKFRVALGVGLILALLLPALIRGYSRHATSAENLWPVLAGAAVLSLGVGVRRWNWPPAVGLLALAFLTSEAVVVDGEVSPYAFTPKEAVFLPDSSAKISAGEALYHHELAADFLVLLKNARVRHKPLAMWYDADEPSRWLYDSLNALYIGSYRDYSDAFAHRPDGELRAWFAANSLLVHLTRDPARIAAHRAWLEQRGFRWHEIGAWNLGRRGPAHRVVLDEIEPPAARP
jgi:hypothetical protein